MFLRRYGTFTGGIDLPDEKDATRDLPLTPWAVPRSLRVPLSQDGLNPARPLVEPGQRVSAAETIARGQDGRPDVLAPLAGTVKGTVQVRVATGQGEASVGAIELTGLSGPWELASGPAVFEWRQADDSALRERIAQGNLWVHRSRIEPLRSWIERARAKACHTLILNAMESQPYVTSDHCLLVEEGRGVQAALAMLARAIGVRQVIVAANQRYAHRYRLRPEAPRTCHVSRIALADKYPTGADPVLVKVLTRREMPPEGTTMDVGAAVIDASTCFALYRHVAMGQAPLGRVVTVSGERTTTKGNFWVPVGAACRELAEAEEPIIHGGPMVGHVCHKDAVVTAATDALLAIDSPGPALATPCIRCGWCTDHCPARLNVSSLNDAFELGLLDRARRLGTGACIECGVCSYVCPAQLPLAQRVKHLKRAMRAIKAKGDLLARETKG